jgi:hypothetical protein
MNIVLLVILRAGPPMCRSSSPSEFKTFLSSMSSIPVLGPARPPAQWAPEIFLRGEAARVCN